MTAVRRLVQPLRSGADVGPRVPALTPRVLLAVAGVLLCLAECRPDGWLVPGLLLTVAAAVQPARLLPWALIVFLVAMRLPDGNAQLSWQFLVLLAGVQVLHVLAAMAVQLPVRGWMQLAVFRRPLLRVLAVQVLTQPVAVLLLWWLAPDRHGHRAVTAAGVGVLAGAALIALAVLLAKPWWDARR